MQFSVLLFEFLCNHSPLLHVSCGSPLFSFSCIPSMIFYFILSSCSLSFRDSLNHISASLTLLCSPSWFGFSQVIFIMVCSKTFLNFWESPQGKLVLPSPLSPWLQPSEQLCNKDQYIMVTGPRQHLMLDALNVHLAHCLEQFQPCQLFSCFFHISSQTYCTLKFLSSNSYPLHVSSHSLEESHSHQKPLIL